MDNYKPVNTPGVPNSLPSGTVKGFLGERPRFSRGRCIGCGKLTYWSEDYTDPRGPLGLRVYSPFVASEYDMVGPNVAACWGCADNDADLYRAALAKAKKFWKPLTYKVTEDDAELFRGTNSQCYGFILRHQPQSVDWAMKYSSYRIESVEPQQEDNNK